VKRKNFSLVTILSASALAVSSSATMAASVDVYAEGAYSASDLVVYVYADINAEPLVSAGVQLSYDSSKLTFASAQKNETDWYFGTSVEKYPYLDPQDTGNSVVFLCGKIDENAPTAGVIGTRKLIGTAKFARNDGAAPGTDPATYFGTAVSLGIVRPAPTEFANFVTIGETVLDNAADGIIYNITIRKRGDANADGLITNADYFAAKTLITNGIYKVYADCNADNLITNADFFCIKSLM
jgi:hypothetical protein